MALTPEQRQELIKKKEYLEGVVKQYQAGEGVKIDESADSPVGVAQRMKMQFGNMPGNIKSLEAAGFSPKVKGGELYVEQGGGLVPVDPSTWSDIPTDIAEFATMIPEIGISAVPAIAGALGGGSVGGPAGAIAGGIAGGTGGSGLAEMFRQGVGKQFGTYEDQGEGLINPEVQSAALIGGATEALLPGIGKGLK